MSAAGHQTLIVGPRPWFSKPNSKENVAEYYNVLPTFEYYPVFGAIPLFRGLEKVTHAIAAVFKKVVRQSDVIYSRNIPAIITALLFTRKPVVFETYRPWPTQRPYYAWFFRLMGNQKRLISIILHSHIAKSSFLSCGVSTEKLLVSHNGFNEKNLNPRLTVHEARELCNLPHDRHIVTYSGRVTMKKGLESILELATQLKHVLFLVIGSERDGEFESKSEEFSNIKVLPWLTVDEVVPYLYASDILLIPPSSDPLNKQGNTVLPMKTFLYMAAKRAIIGGINEDLLEVLDDGISAILVEPDDTEKLHQAVISLLENEGYRSLLAENAYKVVQNNNWSNRGRKVTDFLSDKMLTFEA